MYLSKFLFFYSLSSAAHFGSNFWFALLDSRNGCTESVIRGELLIKVSSSGLFHFCETRRNFRYLCQIELYLDNQFKVTGLFGDTQKIHHYINRRNQAKNSDVLLQKSTPSAW